MIPKSPVNLSSANARAARAVSNVATTRSTTSPEATLLAVRAAVEAVSSQAYSAVITPEYKEELGRRASAAGLSYDAYVSTLLLQLKSMGSSIWQLKLTVDLPEKKVFTHPTMANVSITVVKRGQNWLVASPWNPRSNSTP